MLVKPEYALKLTPRSRLIAEYALCGFGNIGSVGIVVGILSQLAPETRSSVSKVAVSALVAGITATLTSACMAGMLATDAMAFLA
jgi:concentrative nucleoside transporter, CNT family